MKFFTGFIFGIVVAAAVPIFVSSTGMFNMNATEKPSTVEEIIGKTAWEKSLHRRAPQATNPFQNDSTALDSGMDHFKENCLPCHGIPGVEPSEIAKGLNPHAPELKHRGLEEWSDGELFYLVKNGIRMTGMPALGPTHTDQEIWTIVYFLRHIENLSADQKRELQKATEEEEEHHHD